MTPPVLYVKTPDAWPWLLPTFPRVSSSPRTTEPTLPARNMSGDAGTSWSTLAHASMSTALKNSNPTDPAGAFRKSTSAASNKILIGPGRLTLTVARQLTLPAITSASPGCILASVSWIPPVTPTLALALALHMVMTYHPHLKIRDGQETPCAFQIRPRGHAAAQALP